VVVAAAGAAGVVNRRAIAGPALAMALAVGGPVAAQVDVSFPAPLPNGTTLTLTAKLFRPAGEAPRPAVVLMHGCSGIANATRRWPPVLVDWGYVTLMVDSFAGRGVKEVCTRGARPVSPRDRAFDVAGATDWLKAQPFVRADRIAVIGQSHGGATTLFATLREVDATSPLPMPGFAAAVAFYPDCTLRGRTDRRFEALRPTLILIGDKDDWTPAGWCRDLMPRLRGAPVTLHIYPEALHSFDSVGLKPLYRPEVANRSKPGGCCGAWIGYDAQAYRDAVAKVEAFLRQHLGRP
jgi:dienelactone hydrolase